MTLGFIQISSQLNVKEDVVARVMIIKNAHIMDRLEFITHYVLKRLAPVRTGQLRDSIQTIQSVRRESGGSFHGFIKIGPTAPHSRFVIRGTKYMKPNNFVRRAKPIIITESNKIIIEQYGHGKFNIAQYFK